jgi:hypothetical protein
VGAALAPAIEQVRNLGMAFFELSTGLKEVEASTVSTGTKRLFTIRYINTGHSLVPVNFSLYPGAEFEFQPNAEFIKLDFVTRLLSGYTHKIICVDIEAFVKIQ